MHTVSRWLLALVATSSLISAQTGAENQSSPYRLVDLTADGLLDKLYVGQSGALSVSVNRGHGNFASIWQQLPAVKVTSVLATDLDGDGSTDIYLVSPERNVALIGDGTGLLYDETDSLGLADLGHGVSAERVDLDKLAPDELLLHNATGDVIFWALPSGRFERDADAPTELSLTGQFPAGGPTGGANDKFGGGQSQASVPTNTILPNSGTDVEGGGSVLTDADTARLKERELSKLLALFDDLYVNDDGNEVDSADVVDGSLAGGDISTSGGDITFGTGPLSESHTFVNGRIEATKSIRGNNLITNFGVLFGDGSFQNTATLTGPAGPTGTTGATGPAGPTGATGLAGADGADGATGLTGATGLAGADGVDGAAGLTGATGPAGPTGATGLPGADGVDGATGLTGATGPTGTTGLAGVDGADGATGLTGATGPTGATGLPGADGADGATGLTGATGPAGPTGATGATGPTGAIGPQGLGAARIEGDGASGWGIDPIDATQDLMAIPPVTASATIKSVIIHGEDSAVTYSVYSVAMSTGTPTLLGSGTVGTLLDITDFTAASHANYLLIRFAASTTTQTIYGGRMFTDDAGTVVHDRAILPGDFGVSD
jgi:hypothetical protein